MKRHEIELSDSERVNVFGLSSRTVNNIKSSIKMRDHVFKESLDNTFVVLSSFPTN